MDKVEASWYIYYLVTAISWYLSLSHARWASTKVINFGLDWFLYFKNQLDWNEAYFDFNFKN